MEKEKKENKVEFAQVRRNPWIIVSLVFIIISIVLLILILQKPATGKVISTTEMKEKGVNFVNTQLLGGQGNVSFNKINDKGDFYEMLVDYQGEEIPLYFSKDGQYFLGVRVLPLEDVNSTVPTPPPAQTNVPKSAKPKVELFVMTHCPYGTQAEKGILPAIKALGTKVDFKMRFVHYFMHGDVEEAETYNQVCIRETIPGAFTNYLNCFLEDGNSSRCAKKYSLNMGTCIKTKAKDYYAIDSQISQDYGVQGSPTLIINGVEVSSARDPASYLKTICSAYETAPAECEAVLSTSTPSSGFGTSAGSTATGSC